MPEDGGGDESPKVQRGSPLLRAVHRKQSQSASPVASATPRRHSETPTPGDETLRSGRLSSRKQSLRSLRNEDNAADNEVLGLLAMSKNPTRSTCLLVTFILTIGIPTLVCGCAPFLSSAECVLLYFFAYFLHTSAPL